MDDTIRQSVEAWLSDPAIADADKDEIRRLRDAGDEQALADRFYRDLEFGTGGLRGVIGAGRNRMNIYTVGAATQGLANYIARQGAATKEAGVAIAHDSRRMSPEFARRTACVLAGNGIRAYLFEALRPTPELSFAIRHLGCTAGVVITASHNPPEYNGYKAYWSDGGQIVPPHDENIITEVRQVGGFDQVRAAGFEQARRDGLIRMIGRDVDEVYLDLVLRSCLNADACRSAGRDMTIVYTPLHGAGGTLIPEAMKRRGFEKVVVVPEQAEPDGGFPTVEYPNPEEAAALELAIRLAGEKRADLVIATDPDVDRVGAAAPGADGRFELITGNQMGALLCDYICGELTLSGRFPADAAVVSTIVSSDLMKVIAHSYGATVIETLTGFKWIGEKMRQFEARRARGEPSNIFVFGAEESYGYLPVDFVRDKDAVASACYIAELAAVARARGTTVSGWLDTLYTKHGYFHEGAKSISMPGRQGAARIKALMERLRSDPPAAMGGVAVKTIGDIKTGEVCDRATGKVVDRYGLPASNVLIFTLDDATKVIARPSGTEPKIKFYILARAPGDDLRAARQQATTRIEAITTELATLADATP